MKRRVRFRSSTFVQQVHVILPNCGGVFSHSVAVEVDAARDMLLMFFEPSGSSDRLLGPFRSRK